MRLQLAEIRIELATNQLNIRKASQVLLAYEMLDYRFLPATLGLDAWVNLTKRVDPQLGEEGLPLRSSPLSMSHAPRSSMSVSQLRRFLPMSLNIGKSTMPSTSTSGSSGSPDDILELGNVDPFSEAMEPLHDHGSCRRVESLCMGLLAGWPRPHLAFVFHVIET